MFLKRADVSPNAVDKNGQTLVVGSLEGLQRGVRILLEQEDVTPNSVDKGGLTPLSWTAPNGSMCNVERQLKWGDVTPKTADKSGLTRPSRATRRGVRTS